MHYSGMSARDLPEPATLAADAALFRVPVFGFAPQPKLRPIGHGTTSTNGLLEEFTLSYAFIADPENPEDPNNFSENAEAIETARMRAEQSGQPAWLLERLPDLRYPGLWEAVGTVAPRPDDPRTLAERLADHLNHVLINTIDSRRREHSNAALTLDGGVHAGHVQDAALVIDASSVPGIVIDTDPDVIGWAANAGQALILVALPRAHARQIDRSLITIATPSAVTHQQEDNLT